MVNQALNTVPKTTPVVFMDLKATADRLDSLISELYGNVLARRPNDCSRIIQRMENEVAHAKKQLAHEARI